MILLNPTFNEELESLNSYVFIVVMGVSGTGKSTLGSALAKALDMPYVEGDDLHPKSNIEKMSSGHPLTDVDREPWLKLIRTTAERMTVHGEQTPLLIDAKLKTGERIPNKRGVVISCSALRRSYRDILRGLGQQENSVNLSNSQIESLMPILTTIFVYIEGTRDVLMDRMTKRIGHFMKPSMLDSQLESLENPAHEEGVIVISLTDSSEDQVRAAQKGLRSVLNMGMGVVVDPAGRMVYLGRYSTQCMHIGPAP